MSFLTKFGIGIFTSVIVGLIVMCVGAALSNPTIVLVSLGIIALPLVACVTLLVINEVYEIRNDIPFQW